MELKYFRLIKAIAEEGNIANSSSRLFLTQSALSHQLRELEEQLGFKVFLRSRNKWELTEEGTELYHLANKLFSEIDTSFKNIEQIKEGSKGTIRIATECYFYYRGLPDFVQKMGLLYPQIELDLMLNATHHPVPKILANDIDIAIVSAKPEAEELTSIALFEDELFALVHKENLLFQKDWIVPEDFAGIHLIIHSFPLNTVFVYEHFLKKEGIEPGKISAIPLTELTLEMIKANMGITCLPKPALKLFNIPDEIGFKRIGEKGLRRMHYLVVRKSELKKKFIGAFISNFLEVLNKNKGFLE